MYIANVVNYKNSDYLLEQHRVELRKKGYVWRAYLLALESESRELYKNIEEKWNDLHIITGEEIAFIFASEKVSTWFHMSNEMRLSPHMPRERVHSLGEENTALITCFKRVANISFEQLPCLVFDNLINDNKEPIIIPLTNDSDVVSIMKYISIRTRDYLDRINVIRDEMIRGNYYPIEKYNDMKRRFIRACLECKLIEENEMYTSFIEFEEYNNSYAERRLHEMWALVCNNSRKRIYGNSNNGLIERICSQKRNIYNFNDKNMRFERMLSDLDSLHEGLAETIRGIDTIRCSEDAFLYAKTQIEELEHIFDKCNIDEKVSCEIIEDLRKNISSKDKNNYFSEHNIKEIINRIRESETVKCIDDIGRIAFVVESIFTTVALFL